MDKIAARTALILIVIMAMFLFRPLAENKVEAQDDPSNISVELSIGTEFTTIEAIKLTLVVTNKSEELFTGMFSSSQKFDFYVQDEKGMELWKWSRGRRFTMAVYPFTLKPDGSVLYRVTWDQITAYKKPLVKGTYKVVGELAISPRIRTEAKIIKIK